jgi:hypothetical protein
MCSGPINTGADNTFLGYGAGKLNTSGACNLFVGSCAGCKNTTGSNNTLVGSLSGFNLLTGVDNTTIGYSSGYNFNNNNNRNTFIGTNTGFTQSTSNVCNSIAIGVSASVWKSGQLSLGSNTACINTGTTVSYSGSILSGTFSAALCVTINGIEYKIPLYL